MIVQCLLLDSSSLNAGMNSKALASSITRFSAKFCDELDKSTSVVSSPVSVEILLALLALGTTDAAHDELLTVLGFPDDTAFRSSFSLVTQKLKSVKGITLNVANKIYVMEGPYEIHAKLKEDAMKIFDTSFEKIDFGASSAATDRINNSVADKTNYKIKDLISAGSVNKQTRLVLVNAIYFKGTWLKQFDESYTTDGTFHVSATSTIQIPMMYKEEKFRYGYSEVLDAELLEMFYVGGEASMLIVLPEEVDGLDSVLKKLANGYDLLADVQKNMKSTKIEVHIPKFKIETEIDLDELLIKLGIKTIFDHKDSGITKVLNCEEPLYVSQAIQKAFIEVNEEGSQAAAATGVEIVPMCAGKIFDANLPFLVVIMVQKKGRVFQKELPKLTLFWACFRGR